MPTYEYACLDCGTHVEVFQRITEDPLTTCGACGGRLRKVFHPAGILFKGSGFYRTDNRSSKPSSDGGSGEPKKAASSESKGTSGSSEKKSGDSAKGKSA